MKLNTRILVFSIFLCSCHNSKDHSNDFYNEVNYIPTKVNGSDSNSIYTKYFVNKYDTSRKMIINYYDTNKIFTKSFLHGKLDDGKFDLYSYDGKLISTALYKDGIKIYKKHFSDSGNIKNVEYFDSGVVRPVKQSDSLLNMLK
jgi:antitoxin component YwqK of YwqJK toxin-antitoxin module